MQQARNMQHAASRHRLWDVSKEHLFPKDRTYQVVRIVVFLQHSTIGYSYENVSFLVIQLNDNTQKSHIKKVANTHYHFPVILKGDALSL
jgi:hypothetical protein